MRAHGPQAVLPLNYAGPHGMLAYASMDLRFFHRLGATLLDRKPLCGGVRTEAWLGTYGPVPGMRPEQAAQAKLVIAWGNNVTYCNLHFTSVMHDARRNGEPDSYYWRVTQWLFPWFTLIPPFGDHALGGHVWVPSRDPRQLPVCQACKDIYEMYRGFNDGLNETPGD